VTQDRFKNLLPRLRARSSERDAALSEARTGFFFHRNGFRITLWEPEIVKSRPGDLEIRWLSEDAIFIEVKGPGWESELAPADLKAGRQKAPKHIDGEIRWTDPAARISCAIKKALPKFALNRPTMLVVVEDFFVSPMEWVPLLRIIDYRLRQCMKQPVCKVLGAIFLLRPICFGSEVRYLTHFIENESAAPLCAIPVPVRMGLSASNLA
jgi:hypothetical protein